MEAGCQPGGGTHSSRFASPGHRPAERWVPSERLPLYQSVVGRAGDEGAASLDSKKAFTWSKKLAGFAGASGFAATGGVRRCPLSYHDCTGFVGLTQPGGGTHTVRFASPGHRPAIRCVPSERLPAYQSPTGAAGGGGSTGAATGAAAAGAGAGVGDDALFGFIVPRYKPPPRNRAAAAAPAYLAWSLISAIKLPSTQTGARARLVTRACGVGVRPGAKASAVGSKKSMTVERRGRLHGPKEVRDCIERN